MKCPKCEYINGYDPKQNEGIVGEEGGFFKLPINLERQDLYEINKQERSVYGCPKCGNVFIEKHNE